MMFSKPLLALVLAATTAAPALAQLPGAQAATQLVGTWSSGSQAVKTGAGFANPANESFIYPATTGISYSFTSDGFYEIARYRFVSNGTTPQCVTGVMNWVHGHYTIETNGSIIMVPLGDGYQQTQDPCAAQSDFIQNYNYTETYTMYQIFLDSITGYKLHLFQFDGTPLAPQFQLSTSPNMLPTQLLRNVTLPTTVVAKRALELDNIEGRSAETNGALRSGWSVGGSMGAAMTLFGLGLATLAM